MKNTVKIVVVILLVLNSASLYALGDNGSLMPRGTWWQNPEIVKELKLTDDQVAKINAISTERRTNIMAERTKMKDIEWNLEKVMASKSLDAVKASTIIDQLVDIKSTLMKERMKSLLEIRKVLSLSQYTKLKEIKNVRGGRGGKRGFGRGR